MWLHYALILASSRFVDGWGGLDTPSLLRASEIPKGETDNERVGVTSGQKTVSSTNSRSFHSPGEAQRVYVDFDTYTDGADHVYSASERNFILEKLRNQYEPFSITFFATPPGGIYSTIFVNRGGPGGSADNIDFLNQVHNDNAEVNFHGLNIDESKVAIVTTNLILHECGHLFGLRHYDSLGPPGTGLPASGVPSRTDYQPIYNGPQAATETHSHVMSSPNSMGSTNEDLETLNFLDERSLLQLEFVAGRGMVLSSDMAFSMSSSEGIKLSTMVFENSLMSGRNSGTDFLTMNAVVIDLSTLQTGASHEYKIQLDAGEFLTVEVVSFSDGNILNPVDTLMQLFGPDGSEMATNDDDFEGKDSNLIDVSIQSSGIHRLRVRGYQGKGGNYKLWMYTADPTKIATNDSGNPSATAPSPPYPTPTLRPPTSAPSRKIPPDPNPTPSQSIVESGITMCFSGSNTVDILGKGTVSIETLEIGDYVRTGRDGSYSQVYSFSHYDHTSLGSYLQIHCDGGSSPLEVSAFHLIKSNGKMMRAKDVQVNDRLCGGDQVVSNITTVIRRGLYAPMTRSGELIVSNVTVSSYVALFEVNASLMQFAAHAAFAWHRLLCSYNFMICASERYQDGISVFLYNLKMPVELIASLPSSLQLLALVSASPLMIFLLVVERIPLSHLHVLLLGVLSALIWMTQLLVGKAKAKQR